MSCNHTSANTDPTTSAPAAKKPAGKSHSDLMVPGKPVIFRAPIGHAPSQTAKESAWRTGRKATEIELDLFGADAVRRKIADTQPGDVVIFEEIEHAGPDAMAVVEESLRSDSDRTYVVCVREDPPEVIKDLCTNGTVEMGGR